MIHHEPFAASHFGERLLQRTNAAQFIGRKLANGVGIGRLSVLVRASTLRVKRRSPLAS
jgi:hypothetical protein